MDLDSSSFRLKDDTEIPVVFITMKFKMILFQINFFS